MIPQGLMGSPRVSMSWVRTAAIAALCVIGVALGACAPASHDSPVLAIVNGRPITLAEFNVRWSELSESARARYDSEGGKRQFLDYLISRTLLMQEAQKRGLAKRPRVRHRVQRFQEKLLLDQVMEDVAKANEEIDPDELEAYYASHGAVLPAPDRIEVSQIVTANPYAARDIKRMLDEGVAFAPLARRYSVDQYTKSDGGYVGIYQKGTAPPEVEAIIYKLRPGRTSDPIKTESGYYIVKVLSRRPGNTKEILAARERLKQELHAEQGQKQIKAYQDNLRSTALIRIAEASKYITHDLGSFRRSPEP